MHSVENRTHSVEIKITSVENGMHSEKKKMASIGTTRIAVGTKVPSQSYRVPLEDIKLTHWLPMGRPSEGKCYDETCIYTNIKDSFVIF